MPIDLAAVDWAYVGILSGFTFIAALLGSLISFRNKLGGAIIAGILFAIALVYWMYYPHPQVPGPTMPRAVSTAAPAPAAAPSQTRPANPVTTVSPPPATNPVTTVTPPATPAPTPPAGAH